MSQPYREGEKPLSPIKSGLIHMPTVHRCLMPKQSNWFDRIILNKKYLKHGDLFRCTCDKIYIYVEYEIGSIHNYNAILYPRWEECADAAWLAAGGEL